MSKVVSILINGEPKEIEVLTKDHERVRFRIGGREYLVESSETVYDGSTRTTARAPSTQATTSPHKATQGQVLAPLPGVVVEILVKPGQRLEGGEILLRLEAMKMQNNVFAPSGHGVVKAIFVATGQEVSDGQALIEITPEKL